MHRSEEVFTWRFGHRLVFFAYFLAPNQLSAQANAACLTPAPNLDGWYDFDSPSGPTPGVAGFGPDAVWLGNPKPIEGRSGGALQFDGNYLEVSSRDAFNYPTQDFTVSAWIRTTSAGTVFLDKRCPAAASGCAVSSQGWALGVSPAGYLQLFMASTVPYFYEAFAAYSLKKVNDGEWHFLSASLNRSANQLRFLVDGGTPHVTSIQGYGGAISSTRPLRIGGDQGHGPQFTGALDELQIHGRALDPAEVSAMAAAGAGGQCRPPDCSRASGAAALAAWYAFDEKAGQIWSGFAGQNHYLTGVAGRGTGRAGGAATFETALPGGGLHTLNNAPALELAENPITLSAWIRYAPGNESRRSIVDLPGSYTLLLEAGLPRLELAAGYSWLLNQRVDDDEWHHLAVAMEGVTVTFYIDGQLRNAPAGTSALRPVRMPLHIGAFATEESATNGAIDELAIFRSVLTVEEIRTIVDAAGSSFCRRNDRGCVAPPGGLVSWYRFDQTAGIFDDAGQAPNEPFLVSDNSLRAPGRAGAGIRLLEPNDFGRTLGSTAKLNFDAAFTISFWIRPINTVGQRVVMEKMTYRGTRPDQGYRLRIVNGQLELALASQIWTAAPNLPPEQWTHIAVLIVPNTTPVLLIDGIAAGLSTSEPFNGRAASSNPLLIGASAEATLNAGNRAGFDFDELSFYNRPLGSAELEALAQSVAGQCQLSQVFPAKPVFEIRTNPQNIGALVGIAGEPAASNVYATTTTPSGVSVTPATISPSTGTEYRFRNWSLNGSPNLDWATLTQTVPPPAASATYTANYDTYHRLTVTTTGNCVVTPATGFYLAGSMLPFHVTLPAGGSLISINFSLGAGMPVLNGTALKISSPATLEVNCRGAAVPITVTMLPSNLGLQFVADGVTFSNSQTFTWVTGLSKSLNVLSTNQIVGSVQYSFRRWRNATTEATLANTPSVQVTPTGPTQYAADFDRTGFQAHVRPPAGCQIDISPSPNAAGFYPPSTRLTIALTPNPGFAALSLTVTPAPPAAPVTGRSPLDFTLESPVAISGLCQGQEALIQFVSSRDLGALLVIGFLPAAGGLPVRVQGYSPSVAVRAGTLTLTAVPTASDRVWIYRFVNITPGNYSSSATFPAPSEATTYTANYEPHCNLADFIVGPSGAGSVSASLISGERPYANSDCYTPRSVVSLTPRPIAGYQFVEWLGVDSPTSVVPLLFTVGTRPFPGALFRRVN